MRQPAVAFGVNETLSDLSPLGDRFEELGAPAELLPAWFAATLRDGIALTASGAYADFREVGRANLLAQLAGVEGLRRTTAEAAEHVLDGFAALSVHPDVPGAWSAGLRGAWLDREGLPYPEVFERPDASGRDLPSLVRALIAR